MSEPSIPEHLQGLAGSPGIASGPLLLFNPKRAELFRRKIPGDRVLSERSRFASAVTRAGDELMQVTASARLRTDAAELSILDAHLLMLRDPSLAAAVTAEISEGRKNAEWAVDAAVSNLATRLRASEDPYLRERSRDFESVGELLRRALQHDETPLAPEIEQRRVIVASDLTPAQTASFDNRQVIALITEVGSRSSHTAILARALDIPAVVGCAGVVERAAQHETALVFGHSGRVVLSPGADTLAQASEVARRRRVFVSGLQQRRDAPAATRCGQPVTLLANIESPHEGQAALSQGAQGIGLYRTEFLFMDRSVAPSEDEQLAAYRTVLQQMPDDPVTLRTFDLGGDKFLSPVVAPGNQELGFRGVRLALAHPDVLLTQLRAMLRASVHGALQIMVPMVTVCSELQQVRSLLEQAREELEASGLKLPARVPLGAMIEVPAAALNARVLAKQADFLSIGTNDLVQYTCAVDRRNTALSGLANPLDPAILRLISASVEAASNAAKPLSVCGAMASEPLAAALLLGFGVRTLSMEAAAIWAIKEALHRVSLDDAKRVAALALTLDSAEQVHELLQTEFSSLNDLLKFD